MSLNHQNSHLGRALEKIKINYEQRICANSHDKEQRFFEIFRNLVETLLWRTIIQRKNELEREKYKVDITRGFSEDSEPAPFVRIELSPASAFCTNEPRNEAKSIPVYGWLARPNVHAELIEIIQYYHVVPSNTCNVLKACRQWWYTDTVSADKLTIEYVESSIDNWAISSIRHYVRRKLRRSRLAHINFMWSINSKKDYLLPIIIALIMLLIGFLSFRSGRYWAFYSFLLIFFGPFYITVLIREPGSIIGVKDVCYKLIYDRFLIMFVISILFSAISIKFLSSPYAQILTVISLAIGVSVGTYYYIRVFWNNYVAWFIWKTLVFAGTVALIPWSRALASAAIQRRTALSAESITVAWDVISLLYLFPLVTVFIFVLSLIAYVLVIFLSTSGISGVRDVVFIVLVLILASVATPYAERWLLQSVDNIIASVFVQNCQVTGEGSVESCICRDLPKDADIHFYEGDNVVQARLRREPVGSSGDFSNKYDFDYVGDGKTLRCFGMALKTM